LKPRKKKRPRREDLGVRIEDLPKFPDGSPMLPGENWWTMGRAGEQILIALSGCQNESIAESARRDLAELRRNEEDERNARLSR
jgi:hypothetical protein